MANVTGIPVWREVGTSPRRAGDTDKVGVLIVGGGPVGLTLALDLGRRGHKVTLLNRLDFVAGGSKAICFARRTLDIWKRLGVGAAMVARGVVWDVGKVFRGSEETPVYQFNLSPVKDVANPAFINLQQYLAEDILLAAIADLPNIEIRWGHGLRSVTADADGALVDIEAAGERYSIKADWLVACDGSRSTVRDQLGLDFEGRLFEDNFLIVDVRMQAARPAERWFWFDPPFNPGQSALLHKQPDDIWRLDFQLGWNIDREASLSPDKVIGLVGAMLGPGVEFEPVWTSLYTFQCRRMARFVHGRVIFAGDSAHLVSPFGARGCNGGIADADNLGWKLDRVMRGQAPRSLLESYNYEAIATADENILNSSRATDFMTPKSDSSRALRDAILGLARRHEFARPFVNSGRLSTPVSYPQSPLNTADEADANWAGIAPGEPAIDAPLADGWLLEHLGDEFALVAAGWQGQTPAGVRLVDLGAETTPGAANRLDLAPGSAVLVRPDHYVAGRWRRPHAAAIADAVARACGAAA
jgi:3-(3-hydroxy-phenyl)propionate hydroxylase